MKIISLILVLLSSGLFSFSQQHQKIPFKQLKEYEGIYEYPNDLKVSFAASPKDTALVAIINKSEYVLKNESPDVFSTKYDTIHFFRDVHHRPVGYVSKKKKYELISRKVFFPETMWYSRLKGKDIYQRNYPFYGSAS